MLFDPKIPNGCCCDKKQVRVVLLHCLLRICALFIFCMSDLWTAEWTWSTWGFTVWEQKRRKLVQLQCHSRPTVVWGTAAVRCPGYSVCKNTEVHWKNCWSFESNITQGLSSYPQEKICGFLEVLHSISLTSCFACLLSELPYIQLQHCLFYKHPLVTAEAGSL